LIICTTELKVAHVGVEFLGGVDLIFMFLAEYFGHGERDCIDYDGNNECV